MIQYWLGCSTALKPGDGTFDGRSYQARLDELSAQGRDMHGEADLVCSYSPTSVLDAGCGTGRVALELARRGVACVGVDRDQSMLSEASRLGRTLSEDEASLTWIRSELGGMELNRRFDLVVMAGNVPLFTAAEQRIPMIVSVASHVAPLGRLIAGFQTAKGFDLAEYDQACSRAGLSLEDRWSTWDRQAWSSSSSYAVSVHRRVDA